ncbi:MAG: hypothetical protein AABZ55_04290 [Bdellovibrionota bacterium]
MGIESLRILHLSKADPSGESIDFLNEAMKDAQNRKGLFILDSCQRFLYVGTQKSMGSLVLPKTKGLEIFEGKEAYRFLLRVATGLESRIQGETDIFGQLKKSWATCKELDLETRTELSPWIQRIFEDTKEIRTQFIQNAGGASYGSLVRRMLQDAPQGETLLIGAGQLAQSVAPYLLDRDLVLYNRTPESAHRLAESLMSEVQSKIRLLDSTEEELVEFTRISSVVICVPEDQARDEMRISSLLKNIKFKTIPVIHLGVDRRASKKWSVIPGFRCLSDVFNLEKSRGDVRSVLLKKAALACEERAKLRALGGSLSISHGWEDLAAFG